jgi:NET1-associated nuclear protein 1 (U3 small nucleolar RNA-associated protein 17)
LEQNISDGNARQEFLVYINGNHEYVLFDPYGNEANDLSITRREGLVELEETGGDSFTKTLKHSVF